MLIAHLIGTITCNDNGSKTGRRNGRECFESRTAIFRREHQPIRQHRKPGRSWVHVRFIVRSPMTSNSLRDTSRRDTSASERASEQRGTPNAGWSPGSGLKAWARRTKWIICMRCCGAPRCLHAYGAAYRSFFPDTFLRGKRVGCVAEARFYESFYANRRDRTGRDVSRVTMARPPFTRVWWFPEREKLFLWNVQSHETMYQHCFSRDDVSTLRARARLNIFF